DGGHDQADTGVAGHRVRASSRSMLFARTRTTASAARAVMRTALTTHQGVVVDMKPPSVVGHGASRRRPATEASDRQDGEPRRRAAGEGGGERRGPAEGGRHGGAGG